MSASEKERRKEQILMVTMIALMGEQTRLISYHFSITNPLTSFICTQALHARLLTDFRKLSKSLATLIALSAVST
jgi:hypothetical protein